MSHAKSNIAKAIASKDFSIGFKNFLVDKKIRNSLQCINTARDHTRFKSTLREMIHRQPQLFTNLKAVGHTNEQIIEHYRNKIRKHI